jgi:hypothetical protein
MDHRIVPVLIVAAPSLKVSVGFTPRWVLPNMTFAV